LPIVAKGDGVYLTDSNGKQYLDCGDAAVSCLGHSDSDVKAAIHEQLDKVAFAHSGFMTSEPAELLASKLVANAPEGIERVYLVSGGSEAVESGLKLARQYFIERGEPQRQNFIAREQSYHGNTLGALATGGNANRRAPFAPLLTKISHIGACYQYRGQLKDESELEYGLRMANELEAEILRLGPETVIGFVAEPVVGATLGAVPAASGYFKRIREICDQYGILLILDEVMCGMGRTGSLFAMEQEAITADIIAIAKGLGAGYQPIGAMLCSGEIYNAIRDGSGFFQHGHTYMGGELEAVLQSAFAEHPYIGDLRGRGLFRGIELVADKDHKTPFSKDLMIHKKIKQQALENGLICYPMGGTADGTLGDHILLAPPFIINEAQISELVEKLDNTFKQVFA
jgi:hypothetical protein